MTAKELKDLLESVPDDVPVNLYRLSCEYYYGIEKVQRCYNTVDGFRDVEIRIIAEGAC